MGKSVDRLTDNKLWNNGGMHCFRGRNIWNKDEMHRVCIAENRTLIPCIISAHTLIVKKRSHE